MTNTLPVDFGSITAEDDDAPISSQRSSRVDSTPLVQWMTDSRDRNVSKKLNPIANDKETVEATVRLVRDAAKRVGCGVRVQYDPQTLTLRFQAKAKRVNLTADERKARDAAKAEAKAKREQERKAKAAAKAAAAKAKTTTHR
jgi:membrane protein involved in colicin uptake